MTNILASFNKLIGETFTKHRGYVLEKDGKGYRYKGLHFENLEQVDAFINQRFEALSNSLNKNTNQNVNSIKEESNEARRGESPL